MKPWKHMCSIHPTRSRKRAFEEMIKRGAEAAKTVLLSGMVRAMNVFNRNDVSTDDSSPDKAFKNNTFSVHCRLDKFRDALYPFLDIAYLWMVLLSWDADCVLPQQSSWSRRTVRQTAPGVAALSLDFAFSKPIVLFGCSFIVSLIFFWVFK